jgi:NACHT domain- and WD repeat-containing protein
MPQAARTFRIFVSSTFSDLQAERNALQEHVYPRLKELCECHGTRFLAIDLRWGVSEEAANDQQTINICLTEVDRCRDTSPRPNFIVLLGERYGWRPPPPQIEAEQFEAIRACVSADQKALLAGCYLKDANAVPCEYYLRERDADFYEEFDDWDPIERKLTVALRSGAAAAGLEHGEMMKYVASVTEQEIERGALGVKDAPEHVFCFFRNITNLAELIDEIPDGPVKRPTPETTLAEDFVDLRNPESDRNVDTKASDKLGELKQRLSAKLARNVHRYEATWSGEDGNAAKTGIGRLSTNQIFGDQELPGSLDEWLELNEAESPPQNLCVDVWLRLSGVILAEIAQLESQGELDKEIAAHEDFGRDRARLFVPRCFTTGEDALERIGTYLGETNPHPLAVAGVSGSGKSALIAKAALEAGDADRDAAVVQRFIGVTPESSDGRSLLASLCQEISRQYGAPEAAPADYRELAEELPKRLTLATAERRLIVFLDALDQLSEADRARSLVWLPRELPDCVHVVVSALRMEAREGRRALKGSECLATLKAKLPDENVVELRPMSRKEGGALLDLWLEEAGRTLREHQRGEVLTRFAAEDPKAEDPEGEGLPLYLKLAFEEARRWRSKPHQDTGLAPTIPGIIRQNLFGRLSRDENHGSVMVSRSLAYLAAAKNGLSEDELLEVLSSERDRAALNAFEKRSPRSLMVSKLPVVVWSRLYFDLGPYLSERNGDGATLMSFYHRQVSEAIQRVYLEGEQGRDRHRELARYFGADNVQPLERRTDGKVAANLRRLSELPYQQIYGELWDDVYETLTDVHFLEVKAANSGVVEATHSGGTVIKTYAGAYLLQDDFALALERGGGRGGRRRIIVTVTDLGDGLKLLCPHCNQASDFEDRWKGRDIDCPRCGGSLRVNDFLVRRPGGRE